MTALQPHLNKKGTATQLVVDGKPFVMLAGEIHNSSSASLDYMDPIWDKLKAMHLNTVILPLYWELIEPVEDEFDFALLDGLIDGACKRDLRLVLLWFATWKNATSSYAPAWVKADLGRFPRMQCQPGKNANAISCFSREACQADARAFAQVMRHIKRIDGEQHTVLAIQVENEPGVLDTSRDRCAMAEEAFAGQVPPDLIAYLQEHIGSLVSLFRETWEAAGSRTPGTWSEVFGDWADEVFMAWHIAQYIDRVAAAGKAEYNIPMVANAWLKLSLDQPPGKYPSGGPTFNMLDVWKAAASHIDVLAPDIYALDFRGVCAQYTRSDNPLFIPEARRDARAASACFYAFGEHDAICYAPFGIDSVSLPHPLTESYALLAEMLPLLAEVQGEGRMIGFFQQEDNEHWHADLAGYRLLVTTNVTIDDGVVPAGGLIVALGDDEFLVAGRGVFIEFAQARGDQVNVEFLWLEEGVFKAGQWVPGRRLNGDETNHGRTVKLGHELMACKLKLNSSAIPVHHQNPFL
jgi:beta-galactosidase GanA